jgi:alkylation response protein AidB-like acyl-CoA dehydrogenase
MDFALSNDQEMIKQSVRRFLENECPKDKVRALRADEKGYDPEIWRKMVDLGWMGLAVPEAYGGTGGQLLDLAVLFEEMGRSLLPSPFFPTVAVSSIPILAYGTEEQKQKYLPPLVNGEAIWSLAVGEDAAACDAAGVRLRAREEGNGYVLTGAKTFVPYGHVANQLLVAARTKDQRRPEEGITVFAVDAQSPGVSARVMPTIAQDKQCEVVFENVRVPKERVLGAVDKGWEVVVYAAERAAILKAAEMLGGAQAVLDMTTQYSKERVQFGETIGSFQAVQHNLVDLFVDVEGLRYLVYEAAWQASAGKLSALLTSIAKAKANDVYQKVCIDGIKLHGAIGFTEELDVGLYHRCTVASRNAFGTTEFHCDRIAEELRSQARRSAAGS